MGVPQGGVISPLLSNLYLNEVDRRLERAREVTRNGKYTYIEYARFADDLVILIDAYRRHDWLIGAVNKRLREEFDKLRVEINDEKSRMVDLVRPPRPLRCCHFVARPHTPNDCCVRFAVVVTSHDATLVTRRALPLTWTGLSPAGPRQLRLAHHESPHF